MARDIEDFLRKAAERRKQAQGGGTPQQPPAQQPPPQQRPVQPQRQQPAKPAQQRPAQQRPVQPAAIPAELVRRGATVADHVQEHINTRGIAEQVSHLGEEVGLADDKLEQRLHDKFDHSVGDLQRKQQTESARAEASPADELLEMLRNPKSIRQAIILSEILRRPDF